MLSKAREYTDLTEQDYSECRVLSYVGGSTWLRTPRNAVLVVMCMTPVQIRRQFEADPGTRVRAAIYAV